MKNDKKPYYSFQDTKLICRYFVLTTSLQMPPSEGFRPWRPIQGQNCVFRRKQVTISCIAALYTVSLVRRNRTFTWNFRSKFQIWSPFFLNFLFVKGNRQLISVECEKKLLGGIFSGPKNPFWDQKKCTKCSRSTEMRSLGPTLIKNEEN